MRSAYLGRAGTFIVLLALFSTLVSPYYTTGRTAAAFTPATSTQAQPATLPALAAPRPTAGPNSVTLTGDLEHLIAGCSDWTATCANAHMTLRGDGIYVFTMTNIPAGNYQYKAAIDDSFNENYGAHAVENGQPNQLNITTTTTVIFYYDPISHWITDNFNSIIATAAGNFQQQLGCVQQIGGSGGNWEPPCLRSWLEDIDGDGIYTFASYAIAPGDYAFKVALNEKWDVSYGQGGNNDNVPFTVPSGGARVTISFDTRNGAHLPSVTVVGHAHDNNVEYDGLAHDSQNALYRQPFGAVTLNTPIKLRFRTFAGDVTGVKVRFYQSIETSGGSEFFLDMKPGATGVSCYTPTQPASQSCDWWEATYTPTIKSTLYYRFIVTDGTATAYYADDSFKDGGLGLPTSTEVDNSYDITVYDPSYQPIDWMKKAVIYQIFPDRFRNGDKSNDPPTTTLRYSYPPNPNDQVITKPWGTLPEGYCTHYSDAGTNCSETPKGRDYFGGDLRGVIQSLDYLQTLGINTIYFNPIFDAGSDHAYDTQDYKKIDAFFGNDQDWTDLVAAANSHNMRIILDGVFNHLSSDSPFFDRYHHYPNSVGACESVNSPYRSWFTFRPPNAGEPATCADAQGNITLYYDGWAGFDSIPVLNKNNQAVRDYFYASNTVTQTSVTKYWLDKGASGWRLDVMPDGSFPDDYWQQFRQVVKSAKSDAVIIGELWKKGEALPKINGDIADSTMGYRFRNAILGLFGQVDNKGFADDGAYNEAPSLFARKLNSLREDYPDAFYYNEMSLMDSHDTKRILWSMTTPGSTDDTRASHEFNAQNVVDAKKRLQLAVLVQMTVPGAPTIYYGDEVGVTGEDDPDDRRTFPWADSQGISSTAVYSGDVQLHNFYKSLIATRTNSSELYNGSLKFLLTDDANRTMAYGMRETGTNKLSIVAVNRQEGVTETLSIPLANYVRNGVTFNNLLQGGTAVSANGFLTITLPPLSGTILQVQTGQNLTGPNAPTGLTATPANAQVGLSWSSAISATKYNIYRTQVSGGGYELITTTTSLTYNDTGLTNGKRYYYLVRAVDSQGNEGAASNEAGATPVFSFNYALLEPPTTINVTKGITPTNPITGTVGATGVTDSAGHQDQILAQVGYGATSSDPATWTTWTNMTFAGAVSSHYQYSGQLIPATAGTFDLLVRFSPDNGVTWTYGYTTYPGTTRGVLNVAANPDTTPPTAPANLRVLSFGAGYVRLAWGAVSDAAEYQLFRTTGSTPFNYNQPLATVGSGVLSYTDTSIQPSVAYTYTVRAYDAAYNASPNSNTVTVTPTAQLINVTFRVKVPVETPPNDTVYLAGDNAAFGGSFVNPQTVTMTKIGPNLWERTLQIQEGTAIQYKYTRGTFNEVERWGSIAGFTNRQNRVTNNPNAAIPYTQLIDNTSSDSNLPDDLKAVALWRDPLVLNVTSASGPAGTLSANFDQGISLVGSNQVTVTQGSTVFPGTSSLSGNSVIWTPTSALANGVYTGTVYNVNSTGDPVPMKSPYVFTFNVANGSVCANPFSVTTGTDNGQGNTCGSFSYALKQAQGQAATQPVTITFSPNLTFTSSLGLISNTVTNRVITLDGGCSAGVPGTIFQAGPGLSSAMTLTNGIVVRGVALSGFTGYAVDIIGDNNGLSCSTVNGNGGGIRIAGNNNALAGLTVNSNTNGYGILVSSGKNNSLTGSLVGVLPNGTAARNSLGGIKVVAGAQLKFGSGNHIRS